MIPGTTNHCTAHVGYVCSVVCREDCLAVENLCRLLYYPIKGNVSLYSPGALLKIEIRHFDGPVFPYTLAHLVSIPHFI